MLLGVIGPFGDPDVSDLAASQLRGVVAALRNVWEACGNPAKEWTSTFELEWYDSTNRVDSAFKEAASNSDIIIGPFLSSEAAKLFCAGKDERGFQTQPTIEQIKKQVLLIKPATRRVRWHKDFGRTLWHFGFTIDLYCREMLYYLQHQKRLKHLDCWIQSDELGEEARLALQTCSDGLLTLDFAKLPARAHGTEWESACRELVPRVQSLSSESGVLIVHITGIERLVKIARSRKDICTSTVISISRQKMETGKYDGILVPYSHGSGVCSQSLRHFRQHIEQAEAQIREMQPLRHVEFPRPTTVDAESHDAIVHWLREHQLSVSAIATRRDRIDRKLFVTDFRIEGVGREHKNVAGVFLYEIRDRQRIPVALDVN